MIKNSGVTKYNFRKLEKDFLADKYKMVACYKFKKNHLYYKLINNEEIEVPYPLQKFLIEYLSLYQ